MLLTFLESSNGIPLSKHYDSKNGFSSYPHVKAVTSHTHNVTCDLKGLKQFEKHIIDHGKKGHCLLKGDLKKTLENESRAGHSDRNALSNLLVLDVDGVKLPNPLNTGKLTNADVQFLSNQIIAELPHELQNVSYIAQASSSLGLKGDKTSMHIFMFLKVAMPPRTIKLWLQDANFESDMLASQFELSVNGQSLKFPLDASVADNSKLIFISTPSFEDATLNPFSKDNDRIVLVKRQNHSFDLGHLMHNISPEKIYEKTQQAKNKLRDLLGFKKKEGKTKLATVNNNTQEILTNPDRMMITVVSTAALPIVNCNINGGDSKAYWFNIDNPTYMHNFKDEPIFEIEKADPDFYKSIFDLYENEMEKSGQVLTPIVLRDYNTDTLFNGIFDSNTQQFTDDYPLLPTSKNNVESFYMSHGRVPPDFIPDGRVIFNPTDNGPAVNLKDVPYYVNTHTKTKYVLNPTVPKAPMQFGHAKTLKNKCPLIYTIMYHMLGEGDEEFERFINWLAYIYQTRKKTIVAWVLTGTQGTGKGLFYTRILRGLFGFKHVPMRYLQNMEEHFNLYMRDALFLIVDEFHMASSAVGASKMADKLKNQITEPTITIRGMRSNQDEIPSYTNYLFLTNRVDAVNLETGDRRYNISPKQDVKILEKYPNLLADLSTDKLDTELWNFAGILSTFAVEEKLVNTPIDNQAKDTMRNVSMSVFDEFCQALKKGQLSYFVEILEINTASVLHANEIEVAQRLLKSWIANALDEYTVIPMEHIRTIFHVQTEHTPRLSQREFSKRMSRNNIVSASHRSFYDKKQFIRGIKTTWDTNEFELKTYRDAYFTDNDSKLLSS